MAGDTYAKPSFSRGRRWGIGLDVLFRTVVVLAVLVMVNHLSGRHFERVFFSSQTRIQLAPRTLSVLAALTNKVEVTLYYDKDDPLFTTVAALLNEYRSVNPLLHVTVIDYERDAARAVEFMSNYRNYNLVASTNKNLVVFDCEGRVKVVHGDALAEYSLVPVPNPTEREFSKRTAFLGERAFTACLLAVTSPKPFQAYFLQGDGEPAPASNDELGYLKLAYILEQNFVQVHTLSLLGTNTVPADCNLLIVAGPTTAIPEVEVEKIEQFLLEGHRLLALVNSLTHGRPTGLERILAGWGVDVGAGTVSDPDNTLTRSDVIVGDVSTGTPLSASRHPIVNPLVSSRLHLYAPRPVGQLEVRTPTTDSPRVVEVIAYSGPHASLVGDPTQQQRRLPLAVAVENTVKGVRTERGSTRIVAVGDSVFLGNAMIDSAANRDFAAYAVNWLLDRPVLLQGLEPRPIAEFRLELTRVQQSDLRWILLAAMPGAVLLLGGLVWLRRRK